jgi:predicted nucleotidyltransferase
VSDEERPYVTRVARVCSRLNRERARYLVVGATAMQLWGTTRATRDVDILIEPTVENAERVLRALATLGFGFAGELDAAEVATRPVTMVGDVPNVDILTRAWNVRFTDAAPRAGTCRVEGVRIPVLSLDDLIASKQTGRLQDLADVEVLLAIRARRS